MGKVKVGLYCYLIADILTKVLQRCSLSSPLPNIWNLSKLLNLIGCHGNQKDKFAKKYSKIISSEAIRGMKLKLCRNVHNLRLCKKYVFYCCYSCGFVAVATYSFHWLIMRKLKVFHCRYFDRTFFVNVCWVVLHQAKRSCTHSPFWFVAMATESLKCWIKLLSLFTLVSIVTGRSQVIIQSESSAKSHPCLFLPIE